MLCEAKGQSSCGRMTGCVQGRQRNITESLASGAVGFAAMLGPGNVLAVLLVSVAPTLLLEHGVSDTDGHPWS